MDKREFMCKYVITRSGMVTGNINIGMVVSDASKAWKYIQENSEIKKKESCLNSEN